MLTFPVCVVLVAVALVMLLSVTLLAVVLKRTKNQLTTTEQCLAETSAALDRQRKLLTSTEARLAETSASLADMTTKHNEAHRDRQLLLAEAGAHRAVEMAANIPGLTDEERRRIAAKLEVAKANSPKVRII
jgi:septal ring factor EnvC (AmiA/AmiB activator)